VLTAGIGDSSSAFERDVSGRHELKKRHWLRRTWALPLALALGASALLGAGSTFARWATGADLGLGSIFHGELRIQEPTQGWRLKSATGATLAGSANSVDPSLAAGELSELTTPCGTGLTLEVSDEYALSEVGDNLAAELLLTWPQGAEHGVFEVTNQAGITVADGTIGTNETGSIPAGTTGLKVALNYDLPTCDPFSGRTANYGQYDIEVRQT
jgi:hypothetical protein